MPANAKNGRGIKHGNAKPISVCVGENETIGWFSGVFSPVIIFKSTWYSIFERLKQLGYESEVTYFGRHEIKLSCKALFGKSKPLTDKGWLSLNDITSTWS